MARASGPARLVLAAFAAVSAPAYAQTAPPDGIPFGRLLLRPSITFLATHDDNLRYGSEDLPEDAIVSTGVAGVQPRLALEIPFGSSSIRTAYSSLYRRYSSDAVDQPEASRLLDFEGNYQGVRSFLRVRDHLVRDNVDIQQFDQGGELVGFVPFVVHEGEIEAGRDFAARHGASALARLSSARFNERDEPGFFGYARRGLEVRYNYRVSLPTLLFVFGSLDDLDQNREDILNAETAAEERRAGLGWRRVFNEQVVGSWTAGYATMRFPDDPSRRFSGAVLTADGIWQIGDLTRLETGVRREPFQSFFLNNKFYVNTQARLRLVQQLGRSVTWIGGVSWQKNAYPEAVDTSVAGLTPAQDAISCDGTSGPDGRPDSLQSFCPAVGTRRRDTVLRLDFGVGFQMLRSLKFLVGYNFERRVSNIEQTLGAAVIEPYEYDVERLVFKVEAGWL